MRLLVVFSIVVAGCGDDTHSAPDAPQPDAPADTQPLYEACREFDTLTATVPAQVKGTLDAPDVLSPADCAVIDAPYGVESAGPDAVVRIDGLTPGTAYVIKLESAADLAFYLVTGCSTPSGPAANECSLFVDASTGTQEIGRFTATTSSVYVVIDYYASHTPSDQAFTLDVYPEACATSAHCSAALPVCSDGRCVECASSFDCKSSAAPRCDTSTATCVPGVDSCASDDPTEPGNDGPAGASALVPDASGVATASGLICSSPRTEADYFSFVVDSVGETWDLSLAWGGARDLDLEVFDATGTLLGMSFWERPERARLTYLPVGTYYVKVRDFSSQTATPVAYTLTAQRTQGSGCTSRAQCAAEYRNQVFRGDCVAGACVQIDGGGQVSEGDACDSVSDCSTGLACPSFYFVADADTRNVCARTCSADADCAPLGDNYVCTNYLLTNFCVQKCTADEQCPTAPSSQPVSGPWARLKCQVATGRCVP